MSLCSFTFRCSVVKLPSRAHSHISTLVDQKSHMYSQFLMKAFTVKYVRAVRIFMSLAIYYYNMTYLFTVKHTVS